MSTLPTPPAVRPNHFLADLYTFDWTQGSLRMPLVSAAAVGLCLVVGLGVGHPGAALVAAGGALIVGFGTSQSLGNSRVWPMIAAILAMASATLVGTLAGHRSYWLLPASAAAAAIYGVLTIRNSGMAWVGQQAAVTLFVSSGFPEGPRLSFQRAGLTALGGLIQLVVSSAGLRLLPELRTDLLAIPRSIYTTLYAQRSELLGRLRMLNHDLPLVLPAPDRTAAAAYATRLAITVMIGTEVSRHLHIQSGYWVPMTALLVQKPAFFDTAVRGVLRVAGTLAGAYTVTLIVAHSHPNPWTLAALTAFFAFGCFSTIQVNYGLYAVCITSYIVFLLSLNAAPGPEIAHRRAFCTLAGAAIALFLHADALFQRRKPVPAVP